LETQFNSLKEKAELSPSMKLINAHKSIKLKIFIEYLLRARNYSRYLG
jgi:hypothetical protein